MVGLAAEDTAASLLVAGEVLGQQVQVLKDTLQEKDGTLWLASVEPVGRHPVDSQEERYWGERRPGRVPPVSTQLHHGLCSRH